MGHSRIRIKIRRRKVANLATYSRRYTVNNCTIPAVDEKRIIKKEVPWGTIDAVKGTAEFKIPKDGFPQVKPLRKKYKKKYYFKGTKNIRKIISHPSDYDAFDMSKYTLPKMNHVEYMEKLVEHKTKKWEKNHPCPIKDDKNSPDLFEAEYLPKWKAERDL